MTKMQWINIATLLATLIVNSLANILPINGRTTGSISDSFPVLFTPAGYVFSIWGLIYIGLIAFGIYQALPAQTENARLSKVGPWFAIANILNAAWILLWHFGYFTLTLVVMLGLLGSLLVIFKRLRISAKAKSPLDLWLVNIPFSIYLGWISVATIANFAITLFNLGFSGGPLSQEIWTVVVILVATVLGLIMAWQKRQVAYPLVLVWAFIGIIVKQSSFMPIVVTAGIGAFIITAAVIGKIALSLLRNDESKKIASAV